MMQRAATLARPLATAPADTKTTRFGEPNHRERPFPTRHPPTLLPLRLRTQAAPGRAEQLPAPHLHPQYVVLVLVVVLVFVLVLVLVVVVVPLLLPEPAVPAALRFLGCTRKNSSAQ